MKAPRKHHTRCAECGRDVPDYNIVHFSSQERGDRALCGTCFNTEMAASDGLQRFQPLELSPIQVTAVDGKSHTFHFRSRLFGPGVALEAFEVRKGVMAGYQFQVIGEPEGDLLSLLGRLIEKIRRALAVKHLNKDRGRWQINDKLTVRGRIGWDEQEDGRVPLLVVDGHEISWDELGRMMMSCEGWQFKLEIRDKSEEL